MNLSEFYTYILDNFDISSEAARLISNIIEYAKYQDFNEEELYLYLCQMLDGTIGLSDAEIKKVY